MSAAAGSVAGLRIAVEFPGDPREWVELTPDAPGQTERFRAPTLRDAAARTARSTNASFVDLDVFLAESVPDAFAGLAARRPGWSPGTRTESLVHAGTPSTLAGLLFDIWTARVADGVVLRSDDPLALSRQIVGDVLPLLSARGLPAQTRSTAVA